MESKLASEIANLAKSGSRNQTSPSVTSLSVAMEGGYRVDSDFERQLLLDTPIALKLPDVIKSSFSLNEWSSPSFSHGHSLLQTSTLSR